MAARWLGRFECGPLPLRGTGLNQGAAHVVIMLYPRTTNTNSVTWANSASVAEVVSP